MPRLVVLGTGTGVGKTHVSRALAVALRRADPQASIGAIKPVESGISADAQALADFRALEEVSNCSAPTPNPLYGFSEPLAPYLAALRAGVDPIELSAVTAWVTRWEHRVGPAPADSPHWSLVETAGGVFSPLAKGITNYDLALALEPAVWVLVAADALGTIHDTTATLEAMGARGRRPDHVVLSASRAMDASTGTHGRVLRELGIVEPVASLGPGETTLAGFAEALVARETSSRAATEQPATGNAPQSASDQSPES